MWNMASISRNLSDRIGSLGYLLNEKDSSGVNKAFLANTIRDVESHNRREQMDACWRAHRLQKVIGSKRKRDDDDDDDDEVNYHDKRRIISHHHRDDPMDFQASERQKWALKKLQAFSKISAPTVDDIPHNETTSINQRQLDYDQDSSSSSSTSSSHSSQSSESSRIRKHKKDKRSRKSSRKSKSSKKREKKKKNDKKEKSKKKKKVSK